MGTALVDVVDIEEHAGVGMRAFSRREQGLAEPVQILRVPPDLEHGNDTCFPSNLEEGMIALGDPFQIDSRPVLGSGWRGGDAASTKRAHDIHIALRFFES